MSGGAANVPIMPRDAGESTEMRNRVSIVQSSKRPREARKPRRQDHVGTDAGSAVADLFAGGARGHLPPRDRDRLAPARGGNAPHHLARHPGPSPPGCRPVARPGRAAGRQGGHAGLELRPASRALLRRVGLGRGVAHRESAALSGPDRLHREPRRGRGAVLRRVLRTARREARTSLQDSEAFHRPVRARASAGDFVAEPAQLRRTCGRAEHRLHLARVRRAHRLVALLHLGHHRQSQGRVVFTSLNRAACTYGTRGRTLSASTPARR